jgi:hypothetical protein
MEGAYYQQTPCGVNSSFPIKGGPCARYLYQSTVVSRNTSPYRRRSGLVPSGGAPAEASAMLTFIRRIDRSAWATGQGVEGPEGTPGS